MAGIMGVDAAACQLREGGPSGRMEGGNASPLPEALGHVVLDPAQDADVLCEHGQVSDLPEESVMEKITSWDGTPIAFRRSEKGPPSSSCMGPPPTTAAGMGFRPDSGSISRSTRSTGAVGVQPYPPGLPERMQTLLDEGELEEALLAFFREVVEMPEHELEMYRQLPVWQVRIRLAPTIPREMGGEASYRFEPERFADLHLPTQLLLGGDSPPLFRQALEAVAEALPDSRLGVMPGQQHIAMDTAPELFLGEVLAFLRE